MNEMTPEKTDQGYVHSRGMRFPNDPDILKPRIRRLLRSGEYEQKEFEAVAAMLNSDDVVLELGAGIGFMSTAASKIARVKSVHSYEANPALIPYIHEVHKANNVTNAKVTNALLAAKQSKPVDFYIRKNLLASSMEPMLGDRDGGVTSVTKVDVLSIRTALTEISPTVLICDIEGAEAHLLPAADFSGLRCAIVELHPQWIGQKGVQDVFDTMHKAGLTYYPRRSNKKVVTFRKDW